MLGRSFMVLVVFLIPMLGWGQSNDRFTLLIKSTPGYQPDQAIARMVAFKEKLRAKKERSKSDEAFLRYAFRETHRDFLINYKAYTQFPEIFQSGNYDCLSATSLFSVILDEFGFHYKIIETNYHIFLVVEAGQQRILIETTDKWNGFITEEHAIRDRLSAYQSLNKTGPTMGSATDKYYLHYDLNVYQEVMPQQLTGLFYYNQAITAFNNNDLPACALSLKKAIRIYNSPQMVEFAVILVNKIAECDLDTEKKKDLISPFASLIKAKAAVVALR